MFGRYNDFAWSRQALERRVFNLACAAGALAPLVSDVEGAAYVDDLARQARHLLGAPDDARPGGRARRGRCPGGRGARRPAGRGAAATGAAGGSAALPARRCCRTAVHASRSPAARAWSCCSTCIALDDALSQRGAPSPAEVSRAIDRLAAATRFFTLVDGRLAAFQGGEPGAARRRGRGPRAGRRRRRDPRAPRRTAAITGWRARPLQLIVDAGAPAAGRFAGSACAQPGAITVACEGRRLIAGSAWSAQADVGGALRGPEGGSCLGLDSEQPGTVLRHGLLALGAPERLESRLAAVAAERHQEGGETWLDITHDGWRGLSCARRLYVDAAAGELRGEDALTPTGRARSAPAPYTIRFILAPDVAAQVAVDGKSAVLRPSGARGWRLRSDAAETRLSQGAVYEDGEARTTQVLTLHGVARPGEEARVRWKLTRDAG